MSKTYNCGQVIGHLGATPVIRTFQNGGEVANLSVATSDYYKNKAGEGVEKTQWHNVVVFNKHFIEVAKKLQKGDLVQAIGKMETRKFVDSKGIERYTTEIVIRPFSGELNPLKTKDTITAGADEAALPPEQEAPAEA